jgi:hypothetical protein
LLLLFLLSSAWQVSGSTAFRSPRQKLTQLMVQLSITPL